VDPRAELHRVRKDVAALRSQLAAAEDGLRAEQTRREHEQKVLEEKIAETEAVLGVKEREFEDTFNALQLHEDALERLEDERQELERALEQAVQEQRDASVKKQELQQVEDRLAKVQQEIAATEKVGV
jgi:chromosome segregation ATPase